MQESQIIWQINWCCLVLTSAYLSRIPKKKIEKDQVLKNQKIVVNQKDKIKLKYNYNCSKKS